MCDRLEFATRSTQTGRTSKKKKNGERRRGIGFETVSGMRGAIIVETLFDHASFSLSGDEVVLASEAKVRNI